MESTPIITDYVPLKSRESEHKSIESSNSPFSSSLSVSPFSDSAEISIPSNGTLFPVFDILILYFPTFYTENRHQCLNIWCILICVMAILSMPIYQLFRWFDLSENTTNENIFIFIIYFFPFCSSVLRLWFFSKYFTFDLWHYPLNDEDTDPLPPLLRSNTTFRRRMIGRHRFGFLCLLTLSATFCALAIWDAIERGEDDEYQSAHILIHSVQFVFGGVPDVVMICVLRLYFMHCTLSIASFDCDLNALDPVNDCNLSLYQQYLEMHDEVTSFCHRIKYFVSCSVVTVSFVFWFEITLLFRIWFFTDWTNTGHSGISILSSFPNSVGIPLYLQFTVFAVYGIFAVVFMLWPAFAMNEQFGALKERINGQIELLMEHRTYLHDDRILKAMTNNDVYGAFNVSEMQLLMELYSKQKAYLELLTQTRLMMKDKPCTFNLLWFYPLNRGVFRDFALILLVFKVLLFLWYGIN